MIKIFRRKTEKKGNKTNIITPFNLRHKELKPKQPSIDFNYYFASEDNHSPVNQFENRKARNPGSPNIARLSKNSDFQVSLDNLERLRTFGETDMKKISNFAYKNETGK